MRDILRRWWMKMLNKWDVPHIVGPLSAVRHDLEILIKEREAHSARLEAIIKENDVAALAACLVINGLDSGFGGPLQKYKEDK